MKGVLLNTKEKFLGCVKYYFNEKNVIEKKKTKNVFYKKMIKQVYNFVTYINNIHQMTQ